MIFYVFFITFLINLVGNIFLIPYFSAEGAAIAYLMSIAAQSGLFWIKTSIPELKKNILPFLLVPSIAIAAGSLSIKVFDNIILIFLLSIFIFFLLILSTKVLCKNDWSVFRKITGF
jgi:O-antigen/teichoic acid export membrane protein